MKPSRRLRSGSQRWATRTVSTTEMGRRQHPVILYPEPELYSERKEDTALDKTLRPPSAGAASSWPRRLAFGERRWPPARASLLRVW